MKKSQKENDIYITSSEAAKILNISLATLKKFIYQGKIRTLKTPGGHHRILKSDLFKMVSPKVTAEPLAITVNKSNSEIIEEFMDLTKSRQSFLKNHSITVSKLSLQIAQAFQLSASQFYRVYLAALLHDIGLLKIKESVINKKGPLSESEYGLIKTHPVIGEDIANSAPQLREISGIIRQHHERYDGTGYPDGLRDDQICIEARIIGVSEAFACMTAADSYKKTLSQEEALKEIETKSGTQFDSGVAKVFVGLFKNKTGQNE